jgi:uncharacterized membrane protein
MTLPPRSLARSESLDVGEAQVEVKVRLVGWWDDLRDSLWLVPAAVVLLALITAWVAVQFEPLPDWFPQWLVFGGTPEGARSVLSELAAGTITVTGLVFSLTVVALQMASSQFTPRLLRTFMRDRRTQIVLGGLVGSAVYDVAVLRTVRSRGDGVDPFVPALAVTLALVIALFAVGLLVFFLHHVTQHMRVDVVMREVADETQKQLAAIPLERSDLPDQDPPAPADHATAVAATVDGYLQSVDLEVLSRRARAAGMVVLLRPSLGDHVTAGSTLAWVWADDDQSQADPDVLAGLVHGGLHLGSDRTEAGDLAFGIRQLADIAVRALSPGVNDPTTAVQAIEQLAAVMMALTRHPLGADLVVDGDGALRVVVPRPTFAAHLALAIDQIRSYGGSDTDVVVALLGLLTDLAEATADTADRSAAVAAQIDRIEAASDPGDRGDRARIDRALTVARTALRDGVRPATVTEAS